MRKGFVRKRLDFGYREALLGLWFCIWPGKGLASSGQEDGQPIRSGRKVSEREAWPKDEWIRCLSVRTAWDAFLSEVNWPAGSQVLMTALNVPDMQVLVESHGYNCHPMDLDLSTLSPGIEALWQGGENGLEGVRAVLVAHLFGSIVPMEPILAAAHARGWLVIEDCAQAYRGEAYKGHPDSDLVLFSFGPIKTATCLGGALVRIRARELGVQIAARLHTYARRSRWFFARRILKYIWLKGFIQPFVFGGLMAAARGGRLELDKKLRASVRGFGAVGLHSSIRHGPSIALERLLERRLVSFETGQFRRRRDFGEKARELLAKTVPELEIVGREASEATYWVFPVLVPEPELLARWLAHWGFDASSRATLGALSKTAKVTKSRQTERRQQDTLTAGAELVGRTPTEAQRFEDQVLYLPIYPELGESGLRDLIEALTVWFADRKNEEART